MDFKTIVLFSALILLIVILILIGVSLSYSKTSTWPPMVPKCPDFWVASKNENDETVCTDVNGLLDVDHLPSTCTRLDQGRSGDVYTFKTNVFMNDCARHKWAANECRVAWDGISYGYGVKTPCEETETDTQ